MKQIILFAFLGATAITGSAQGDAKKDPPKVVRKSNPARQYDKDGNLLPLPPPPPVEPRKVNAKFTPPKIVKDIPPPPPPVDRNGKPLPPPKVEVVKFAPPKIVKDKENTPPPPPPPARPKS